MTLAVHPLFGQELAVRSSYGPDAVWVETTDGKLRLLPLAWTSLVPRRESLEIDGQVVRLAPEALLDLAAWVAARAERATPAISKKIAAKICTGDNSGDGKRPRRGATAAVVGKARSPGSGSRVKQG